MPENPPAPTASVTFIGNATTVLRLGDFTLLTDPNFVPSGTRLHLYDDYTVVTSPLEDFLDRAREHGLAGVQPIHRGSTLDLPMRRMPGQEPASTDRTGLGTG